MERPIYIRPRRWKLSNFEIHKCVICLEQIEKSFKIHKKKYNKISQNKIIERMHKGKTAYPISKKITTLRCLHKFHENCIKKWFKISPTCPLCRK